MVTTLVVSGVVVLLLASLLMGQVGRGLVSAKTEVALTEAQSGLTQAQQEADANTGLAPAALEGRLQAVALKLTLRGQSGDQFAVALIPASGDANVFASSGVDVRTIPLPLVRRLEQGTSSAYVYRRVGDVDQLVVGSNLSTDIGQYRLYHLFPLTAENETMALVRRTSAIAGLLLVLLLALIAALVARQVVLPVRLAARTAPWPGCTQAE